MERRLFEDLVDSDVKAHTTAQKLTVPMSVAVHVVLIGLAIVVPILYSEDFPEPAATAIVTFFEPPAPPPPPPPPPPPKPKRRKKPRPKIRPKPKPVVQEAPKFTAPVVVPEELVPEESFGLDDFGVEGGVEGGVPGGVVGGVVGGLPDAPPPPKAVRVGGNIKEPRKIKHVAPIYPDIARQARIQGIVILECTISPQGRVTNVKVLRGIPLLDQSAVSAVKQWVYTPTLLNGVPVPVIMTVTVNFIFA